MAARLQRRCVVCRESTRRDALLRIARDCDNIVIDRENRLPGRGAYVHRKLECLSRLTDSGRIAYALRMERSQIKPTELAALRAQANELVVANHTGVYV